MNTIPSQMVRVGIGDEALQVPLYRLPYLGGADGSSSPGGFFINPSGEFGVAVDARLSFEEVQQLMTAELQKNAPFIAAAIAAQTESKKSPRSVS